MNANASHDGRFVLKAKSRQVKTVGTEERVGENEKIGGWGMGDGRKGENKGGREEGRQTNKDIGQIQKQSGGDGENMIISK